MTLRTRLLAASLVVVLVPLAVFGFGIRQLVSRQLTEQYGNRVDAMVGVLRDEIEDESERIATRLAAATERLAADNRFRQTLLQGGDAAQRAYVLDYAGGVMRTSGLAMLQVQNPEGRIVSSGHFRNEFDLLDPALPAQLAATRDGYAAVRARTAEGSFLALARAESVAIAGRRYTIVGGTPLDAQSLAGLAAADELSVRLVLPGDTSAPSAALLAGEIVIPYIATTIGGEAEVGQARFVVGHSAAPLVALQRSIDRWFGAAVLGSAVVAGLIAGWLASRVARPIASLAERTARLDLDQLDVSFASERGDEVGQLERFLDAMAGRLRASVRSLKEVERRAAMGDLARQVNHDIKNGMTPIRNVLRHLTEVARERPNELPGVFEERRKTLESSVEYLERLAANYASLLPKLDLARCDLNDVVRTSVAHLEAPTSTSLRLELSERPVTVRADRLALRRSLENLMGNAVESLDGHAGTVTVSTTTVPASQGSGVGRLTVTDTGPGMTREELDKALGDFYTTKPSGAGLGLTIVRRLVSDLGGTFRVETEPGRGTTCTLEFPLESDA